MSNSNVAMAEVLEIPKRRGDYGKGSITQRVTDSKFHSTTQRVGGGASHSVPAVKPKRH